MFDFIRGTLSSAMSMITGSMSEVKLSPGSDPASCPIPNTTLPVLTQCPSTNSTTIQEYLDNCFNSVPTPDLVDKCMEDCVNCCPSNSTISALLEKFGLDMESVEKNIKTLIETFTDCGQPTPPPTSPPDVKSKSGSPAAGWTLISLGAAAYLGSMIALYKTCQVGGLTKQNFLAWLLTQGAGSGCLTTGVYLLFGGTAAGMVAMGSVGIFGVTGCLMYRNNLLRVGAVGQAASAALINAEAPLLNPAGGRLCAPQCGNPFDCC